MPPAARSSTARIARFRHRAIAWALLLLVPVATLIAVLVPVWIIHPYASQSPAELKLAYVLRAWSPLATIFVLLAALAATVFLWHQSIRWWQRSAMVVCVMLAAGTTWLARQNHFEWLFTPLAVVEFAPASAADFVEDDDKVLAVELHGDAAAYPLRQLAYHHVVQDDVGGVPIAVTY